MKNIKHKTISTGIFKLVMSLLVLTMVTITAFAQPPSLFGDWEGYFQDGTKSQYIWRISQNGPALNFLDVGAGTNTKFSGRVSGSVITDSNKKTGMVSEDRNQITWSDGIIWRRSGTSSGSFEIVSGSATDIDIGKNGTVWRVGNIVKPIGSYVGVSKLNGNDWETLEGNAVRVAVNQHGDPWIVLDNGTIMRRIGNHWKTMPSPGAVDIAIGGPNGEVWIIDKGGYARRWKNYGWNDVFSVDGRRIAVDDNGEVWVTTKNFEIMKFDGTNWKKMQGSGAVVIGARAGSVYVVTGDQNLTKWTGSGWRKVADGPFFEIAVDNKGMPWGINPNGEILKDKNSTANVPLPPDPRNAFDSYWCMTQSYNFFRSEVINLTQDIAQRQVLENWFLPNVYRMCGQRSDYKSVPTCFKDNYNKTKDKDKAIRNCRLVTKIIE